MHAALLLLRLVDMCLWKPLFTDSLRKSFFGEANNLYFISYTGASDSLGRPPPWTSNNVPVVSSFFYKVLNGRLCKRFLNLELLDKLSLTRFILSFPVRANNEHALFHCVPIHIARKHETPGALKDTRSALTTESRWDARRCIQGLVCRHRVSYTPSYVRSKFY